MRIEDIDLKLSKLRKEIDDIDADKEEIRLLKLVEKADKLAKKRLDLIAENNPNFIQDKSLRDCLYNYTNGEYRAIADYSDYLKNGFSDKEAYEKLKFYHCDKPDEELKEIIKNTKKILKKIEEEPFQEKTLIRIHKTQMNENFTDCQKKYEVGEVVDWGIRSTSMNENYFEKVANGDDKIELENFRSAYPHTYTEFRILSSKFLNISDYSKYQDQDEALIYGKFKVLKVENFKPKIVYEERRVTFEDYLKENNYVYEERITKSGKDFISIYDENNNRIFDADKYFFTQSADSFHFGNDITFEKIINGDVPYKIYKFENKEKSVYGIERQIVFLKQLI